jgi:hypothetical protein
MPMSERRSSSSLSDDGFAVREISRHQAAEGAEVRSAGFGTQAGLLSRKWWSSSSFFSSWLPCGEAAPPAQPLRTAAARFKF